MFSKGLFRAAALSLLFVTAGVLPARAGAIVFVDVPRAEATVPRSFVVGGWALDDRSQTNSGVSGLHVWAYPHSGAAPIFLAEVYKGPRPDVAQAYGPQFMQAGFSVVIRDLQPGGYLLVAFPFSSVTQSFEYPAALARNIYVRDGAPIPTAAPAPAPAPSPSPSPSPAPTSGGQELRVLQWNIHHLSLIHI